MIALNNGDKLRADASVANKIDFTIHGITGDVVTQLANGQFAAAEADIFTAANDGTIVTTIICVNTHDVAVTCNIYLKPSGGTSRKIIPVDASLESGECLLFDGTRVSVTGAVDEVTLGTGNAVFGRLAANSGVDIGDVDVTSHPADTFVAEGGTLGKGVLLQGDDDTDRHNVKVGSNGRLHIRDVNLDDSIRAEGAAAVKGIQISLDDGTDSQYAQANAAGDLKVTLDSETVVLGTGSAAIGKLAANTGVDIGDVDVLSLPNKLAAWTQVVVNISTATTTALIAANAGHTYTILTISLTIAAENNLTFKSASTAKTGPMDFGAAGESHGWQANFWPVGIKCVAGEALNLTTTTTGQVSGIICVLDES
jgi:hypothetical protein